MLRRHHTHSVQVRVVVPQTGLLWRRPAATMGAARRYEKRSIVAIGAEWNECDG
jgi:hypothetical protein